MSAKIISPAPGRPEVIAAAAMIEQADAEGFGSCSNEGECEAVCPKEIPISNIARMTREYVVPCSGSPKNRLTQRASSTL
jgi:succinate dehydrogenase / fumarate reductase iron-sulfur subunit